MFGRSKGELEKPPIAREPGAREILRVWGGPDLPQQFVLKTTWDDPGAWGLLLADVARHAAKAYGNQGTRSETEAMGRIVEALKAELGSPTDDPVQVS